MYILLTNFSENIDIAKKSFQKILISLLRMFQEILVLIMGFEKISISIKESFV